MATVAMCSFAPTPLYDIQRNDCLNENYQVPINDGFHMGSEESFYPLSSLNEVQAPTFPYFPIQQPSGLSYFQPPQMGFTPTFPTNGVTYNGGMAPTFQSHTGLRYFQTPVSSFTTPPSLASSSSTLPQHPLTPTPTPLRKALQKASRKSKSRGKRVTRNATQTTKGELLIGKPKRRRGPNKRPSGMAFSSLLDGLPNEVREALEKDYKGCCEKVDVKDASTKQKHMFSNRHCKNLPLRYQEHVPNFVCPAFVALKSSCRSKVGRYDSTYRHCKNCLGFDQINKGNKGVFPVLITRTQYNSIQHYRMSRADSEWEKQATDQRTEQADAQIRMVLAEVFRDGFPDWFPVINLKGESRGSGAIMNDTTSVVVPVASNLEQPSPYEPSLFDPDSANGCSEALKNGFPVINLEGESNNSGAVMDPSVQLSATSVPLSRYELSLFDPETANECAESLKNGFPVFNLEGESNVAPSQSLLSVPFPVAQSEFYEPLRFDLERVDEWGPFLSGFA